MSKFFSTLSSICLLMAITTLAQQPPSNDSNSPVLDTTQQPLQRGVEYYIIPDPNQTNGSDSGGGLTLVDRNGSCPFYVGQEGLATSLGFPVIFTPFVEDETVIRESRDFTVVFSASTICVQSTAWRVGETEPESGRRLIVTGNDDQSKYGGYFRINREGDSYNLAWCPTDVCPICRFACGSAGILVENGKRLLALDGPAALPVVFQKA